MAGAGFKDFVAGDVLTAAQVDTYLMQQTVMTFASDAARDSALSGSLSEGLHCYTTDNNRLYYYNGSAWIVLSEPVQSWSPTITQNSAVTGTVDVGYSQRSNGGFTASLKWTSGGAGSTNSILVSTPYTLADAGLVGGTWVMFDASDSSVETGVIAPSSTTQAILRTANADYGSWFTIAPGDILHVTMQGWG